MSPTIRELLQERPQLRQYIEVPAMPQMIIGCNGQSVSLLDATVEDLRAYRDFLDRRVQRRKRRARRTSPRM
jgi:hypothetical protein